MMRRVDSKRIAKEEHKCMYMSLRCYPCTKVIARCTDTHTFADDEWEANVG